MRILIAEDDPVSRRILQVNLQKWGHEVVVTTNGLDAYEELQAETAPSLAILDWMMPGLNGVDVCRQIRQSAGTRPVYIILLTALNRSENIVEGLEAGADDYLTKPFDAAELRGRLQTGARIIDLQNNLAARVRQLEAAIIERQAIEEQLRNLSLTDDLTGLYNRRGFYTLAEHHMKIAHRSKQGSMLLYADMDGLKQINDIYGHTAGSEALAMIAEILRSTFRESDIIGRLGGDEFAVLAGNVGPYNIPEIETRLIEGLRSYNAQEAHPYKLSMSIGSIAIKAGEELSIEDLIARADSLMYEDKRRKKNEDNLRAQQLPSSGSINVTPSQGIGSFTESRLIN